MTYGPPYVSGSSPEQPYGISADRVGNPGYTGYSSPDGLPITSYDLMSWTTSADVPGLAYPGSPYELSVQQLAVHHQSGIRHPDASHPDVRLSDPNDFLFRELGLLAEVDRTAISRTSTSETSDDVHVQLLPNALRRESRRMGPNIGGLLLKHVVRDGVLAEDYFNNEEDVRACRSFLAAMALAGYPGHTLIAPATPRQPLFDENPNWAHWTSSAYLNYLDPSPLPDARTRAYMFPRGRYPEDGVVLLCPDGKVRFPYPGKAYDPAKPLTVLPVDYHDQGQGRLQPAYSLKDMGGNFTRMGIGMDASKRIFFKEVENGAWQRSAVTASYVGAPHMLESTFPSARERMQSWLEEARTR